MESNTDCRRRAGQKTQNAQKVPRYYPIPIKRKPRGPPPIPKFANWGFTFYHPSIKVLIMSVFLAFVSLTTPFWAYVDDSTFGLWMFCSYSRCTSIHDNLVPGRSVPAWYHLTQGSFCIGTVACLVGLGILVNNVYGTELKMTKTVHTMAVCVLGIAAMQMTVALCTFSTYFEHTHFLYQVIDFNDQRIDFHGSFYCGLLSTILTAVAALIILLDDSITKASKMTQYLMRASRGQVNPAELHALYNEYTRQGYYDYINGSTRGGVGSEKDKNLQINPGLCPGNLTETGMDILNKNDSSLNGRHQQIGDFKSDSQVLTGSSPLLYSAHNPAFMGADVPINPVQSNNGIFSGSYGTFADNNSSNNDWDRARYQLHPVIKEELEPLIKKLD